MSEINDPLLITENGYSEKKFKKFKIRVYHNDGPIPRFHLIQRLQDTDFVTCIDLFDTKYSGAILSDETFIELYEYLSADDNIFDNSIINWKGLCILWDSLGNDMSNFNYNSLTTNKLIPDYTQIKRR